MTDPATRPRPGFHRAAAQARQAAAAAARAAGARCWAAARRVVRRRRPPAGLRACLVTALAAALVAGWLLAAVYARHARDATAAETEAVVTWAAVTVAMLRVLRMVSRRPPPAEPDAPAWQQAPAGAWAPGPDARWRRVPGPYQPDPGSDGRAARRRVPRLLAAVAALALGTAAVVWAGGNGWRPPGYGTASLERAAADWLAAWAVAVAAAGVVLAVARSWVAARRAARQAVPEQQPAPSPGPPRGQAPPAQVAAWTTALPNDIKPYRAP